ncbi:phosphatidylglycerophosphate phosphatase 1, chloroplastic/mitochondrial isoform X1 [Typha latifolia]|uniref:phosphatidylglycerophosphate phosphatase 1, chloroplastic/mitochondrial isoform X1 n=1 Tax=Typha latifolia TaxID=4733 RepID=UPI003C2D3F76
MSGISLSPLHTQFIPKIHPCVPATLVFYPFHSKITKRIITLNSTRSTTTPMSNWWRRSLGQRFNPGGIVSTALVALRDPRLALPHLYVPDICWVDWDELRRLGFRGVIFDKDNTLTAPYSLSLWPPLADSLLRCRAAFPGTMAILSNSAGLYQYDPDGSEARALEDSIEGIHVIRHETKKPAGTAEEIERYFGCPASLLVMVGDRHFTDIVYGNRNGLLTILTEPLSLSQEPFIVKQVRKFEKYLAHCWYQKGVKPVGHALLLQRENCVKFPSL